jgi:PKD repeat protein
MKTLYPFCLSIIFAFQSFSQQSIEVKEQIKLKNNYRQHHLHQKRLLGSAVVNNKAASCDMDTVMYSQYKSTNTRFISLNATNSAVGYGQYFPVKDSMIVYGFTFYAYAQTIFGSETATANLYIANSLALPSGAPLKSETVTVPWNSAILSQVKQTVLFATPITVFYDFVISIESPTTAGINVATSDWDVKDGRGKYFACGRFANGWVRSSNITIGTTPSAPNLDADAFLEPIVSYKLKSDFRPAITSCLGNGEIYNFKNTSSPIMDEAFNPAIVDTTNDLSFEWNYGDGSPIDMVEHGANNYSTIGITSYNVSLRSTFSGWTMPTTCTDLYQGTIVKPDLKADFSTSLNLGVVTCTDKSKDAVKWFWDFGDGATDTIPSPSHTYAAAGIYQIKLRVHAGGCLDSTVNTINIISTGIDELSTKGVGIYPNPVSSTLNIDFSGMKEFTSKAEISIYTLTGQLKRTTVIQSDKAAIAIGDLAKGNYLVKVLSEDGKLIGTTTILKE